MKLIYFKAPGRAESCRLMLGVRQKPFQDVHITRDQWPEAKKAMKFGQVPVLELEDGKQLVQSAAITRYIAQHTDFYPADPWQRALADEAMALTEDVTNTLRPAFLTKDEEERKAKFQEIIDSTFADKANFIEKVLTAQPGPYILGDTPSYADWHMFGYVAQFMAGMFGIPATLWDKHPAVVEFRRTMAARDDVQQYYKQFEGDAEYMGQRIGFMP